MKGVALDAQSALPEGRPPTEGHRGLRSADALEEQARERCPQCNGPIEVWPLPSGSPIALDPVALRWADAPPQCRYVVLGGVANRALGEGTDLLVRVPHLRVCPMTANPSSPALRAVWNENWRKLRSN